MVETQHLLSRIRPPRVQITYDVEIGNAIEMKEIPFVVGIMADLSGNPANPLPKLKARKFVEIDVDSFNDVMASINPRLTMQVPNTLANDGSLLNIELFFKNMDDFGPINVLKQVPSLATLYEARTRLTDLMAKLDGNDALDSLLQEVLENTDMRKQITDEIQVEDATPDTTSPAADASPKQGKPAS